MSDLHDFFEANPRTRRLHAFDEQSLSLLSKFKIPADILEFLRVEGLSTYRDDFWWTTLPQYHFQTLSEWGLPGKSCYAFLRTALGGLFFIMRGKIYRLNPFTGYIIRQDLDFCILMNRFLTMDAALESSYFDVYQKGKTNQMLQSDEIFALVPALPLGGSFEVSKLEAVKMHEHLAFLAQLFDNKVRRL